MLFTVSRRKKRGSMLAYTWMNTTTLQDCALFKALLYGIPRDELIKKECEHEWHLLEFRP